MSWWEFKWLMLFTDVVLPIIWFDIIWFEFGIHWEGFPPRFWWLWCSNMPMAEWWPPYTEFMLLMLFNGRGFGFSMP